MARRITDESVLLARVVKMLPKGIPAKAIRDVECDPTDGEDGGPSYWVILAPGYICTIMECHTIHEDTLKEVAKMMKYVEEWPDDPDLVYIGGVPK